MRIDSSKEKLLVEGSLLHGGNV